MNRRSLNITPSFENNDNFCMVLNICKSSNLSREHAGSSSILLQIKTLVKKERLCCYANGWQANALVSGNSMVIITVNSTIIFTKQPSAERYLANIFSTVFLWSFRTFLQLIKKTFQFFKKKSLQKTPVAKSYFSKLQAFLKRCLQNLQENACAIDSFNKFVSLRL